MKKLTLPLLFSVIGFWTLISVPQVWAAVTYTITNGSTVESVVPISKAESAEIFYDYVTPGGSHGHPDFGTESNTGFFWLYEDTNTGNISLGMIFDTRNDAGGGTVHMSFAGVPGTGFIEVADDLPGSDITDDDFDTTEGDWLWYACCGDGGVIGGLNGSWEIVLNLLSSTGIDNWYFLNGTGDPVNPGRIALDMTQLLTISAVPEPPPPALVGYWKFDETNGNTALDSSDFGNHGTIYGATRTTGQCMNALNFDGGMDGTDDYVLVRNSDSINVNKWTVSFWLLLNDVNARHVILHKRNGFLNANYQIVYRPNFVDPANPTSEPADYLLAWIGDGSEPYEWANGAYAPVDFNESQFYHIAATYDQTVLKLYVDGREEASKTITLPNITGNGDLHIGTHGYTWMFPTYGIIDEVRIYNYARTPFQILADMECPPVPAISGCIQVNGNPLANKEVILKQQGGPNLTTMTDLEGHYEFWEAVVGDKIKFEVEGPMSD